MKELENQQFSPEHSSSKKPKFVLSSSYEKWASRVHIWQPPTDLYETSDEFVVQVEIAGMRDAEFTISIEQRMLVIQGVRNVPNTPRAYYQMEISSGDFMTAVSLPAAVILDEIQADYSDGFLRIVLPKAKPSQVEVKSESDITL